MVKKRIIKFFSRKKIDNYFLNLNQAQHYDKYFAHHPDH